MIKAFIDFAWAINIDYLLEDSKNVLHDGKHGNNIVYVGGSVRDRQPILFGIDITGAKIRDIRPQLMAGRRAIEDSHLDVQVVELTNHFSNGHLSNEVFRRTLGLDTLNVILKYGTHKLGTAITEVASEIISAVEWHWINNTTYGEEDERDDRRRSKILPIGRNWTSAAGIINLEECTTYLQKMNRTITASRLEFATQWATKAVEHYPYRNTWQIGILHERCSWHLCIRIANKSYYLTYEDTKKVALSVECPKGICDNTFITVFRHDEL